MNSSDAVAICKNSLTELSVMVTAIEREVVAETQSIALITDNINFFTKSFLITLCAHLEMCIKDVVLAMADGIDARLSTAAVPMSIMEWKFNSKSKRQDKVTSPSMCEIGLSRKDVDDLVSGNVYKTRDALLLVGVDLAVENKEWEAWKDLIQTIVTRRNNVVHHNDDASDLSFGDIKVYIKKVEEYLDFICKACDAANKISQGTL